MDTIFALATPSGRSGVAVIRVSGPKASEAAWRLAGLKVIDRKMSLRWLMGADGTKIDQALLLFFKGPRSFTGEDVLEIQSHGSVGVIKKLLSELGSLDGLRMAEAGEFSQRALYNGKLDLTEIEGLGELLVAETEAQVQQATRLMSGDLSDKAEALRERLLQAKALIEVAIDFTDEDIEDEVYLKAKPILDEVLDVIGEEMSGIARAVRVRSGLEVAIMGAPNVGKSTLLNRIARREVALVSELAGTTRDVLEAQVEIDGQLVRFLDTAGLRESEDPIENAGVARAKQRGTNADLRVWLIEPGQAVPAEAARADLVLIGKADIDPRGQVSGVTGQGLDVIFSKVRARLAELGSDAGLSTNERHKACLETASRNTALSLQALEAKETDVEIAALYLDNAASALDSLTGRIDVEDVLGTIFQRFCIGK